jgi:hypothetical protein
LEFIEHLDSFSSGAAFENWEALLGPRFNSLMRAQLGAGVRTAKNVASESKIFKSAATTTKVVKKAARIETISAFATQDAGSRSRNDQVREVGVSPVETPEKDELSQVLCTPETWLASKGWMRTVSKA